MGAVTSCDFGKFNYSSEPVYPNSSIIVERYYADSQEFYIGFLIDTPKIRGRVIKLYFSMSDDSEWAFDEHEFTDVQLSHIQQVAPEDLQPIAPV